MAAMSWFVGQGGAGNLADGESVQRKDVVVDLAGGGRTWTAIAHEAEAVGALGEGRGAGQRLGVARDVVDDPVVEAARHRGVVVVHGEGETLGAVGHTAPVERGSDVLAGAAELVESCAGRQ